MFSYSNSNEEEEIPSNKVSCEPRLEITEEIPATIRVAEGRAVNDGIATYYEVKLEDVKGLYESNPPENFRLYTAQIRKQEIGSKVKIKGKIYRCLARQMILDIRY